MKKFLAVILVFVFLFLIFSGIKKGKHYETQGIASVICLACMGFR
jgi:nucleoside recognition membrane protein YjiH